MSLSVHGFCPGEQDAFGIKLGFRSMVQGLSHYMEFDGIVSDKNPDALSLKLRVGFHSFTELSLTRLFLILFCAW